MSEVERLIAQWRAQAEIHAKAAFPDNVDRAIERVFSECADQLAALQIPQEKEFASVLAQLRHGYKELMDGEVKNQHAFARGIIGPQIEKLERLSARLAVPQEPPREP